MVEALEKAAEQEGLKCKRKVKPNVEIPEELQFVYRERSRIGRILSVINQVNKALKKKQNEEDGNGKKSSHRRREKFGQEDFDQSDELMQLPVSLGSNLRLVSLGTLIPGDKAFECHSTPFPVGFCSERVYKQPEWTGKLRFRSEILNVEGKPLFRVTSLSEDGIVFEADNPSEAWKLAIDFYDKKIKKVVESDVTVESGKRLGNLLFGLSDSRVIRELLKLPEAVKFKSLQRANRRKKGSIQGDAFEILVTMFPNPA
jgi:hypothetical protein